MVQGRTRKVAGRNPWRRQPRTGSLKSALCHALAALQPAKLPQSLSSFQVSPYPTTGHSGQIGPERAPGVRRPTRGPSVLLGSCCGAAVAVHLVGPKTPSAIRRSPQRVAKIRLDVGFRFARPSGREPADHHWRGKRTPFHRCLASSSFPHCPCELDMLCIPLPHFGYPIQELRRAG